MAASLFAIFQHHPAKADLASLEARIEELEKKQAESFQQANEDKSLVKSFLRDNLSLGGFFEHAISAMSGPNTPWQASANAHTLGLNIAANFNEEFRFVSQIVSPLGFPIFNPHGDGRTSIGGRKFAGLSLTTLITQAYGEFRLSPLLNIQTGMGYVPFGYSFQQRELVLFIRRGGPQLLSSNIVSLFWTGLHAYGSQRFGSDRIGYDLYTVTPLLLPHLAVNNLGWGARTWYNFHDIATIGLSGQTSKVGPATYQSYGLDLRLQYRNFGLTAEYGRQILEDNSASPVTYYFEPFVTFFEGKVILFVAADYLDNPTNYTSFSAALPDPISVWKLGGGINYLPYPYTRLRLGYFVNNYVGANETSFGKDRDYSIWEFSAGIAF